MILEQTDPPRCQQDDCGGCLEVPPGPGLHRWCYCQWCSWSYDVLTVEGRSVIVAAYPPASSARWL